MASPAQKPRVLCVNHQQHIDPAYWAQVSALADFTFVKQAPHREFAAILAQAVKDHGPFVAFIVFVNWGEPHPWPLNEWLVAPLVDAGCKFISHPGAGFEKVDVKYLTSKGVFYANNPSAVAIRTADSTAMMILQALRASSYHEARLRQGIWMDRTMFAKDARVSTLGIVGMGRIGKLVAEHMQYFGMKVIYTKRTRLPEAEENGAKYVSFDELLTTADVISLHCPLHDDTRHLIGAPEFLKMKKDVIIVNSSRGPVIDEQALVDALKSGKVLRCALDVFEEEPKVHPYLMGSTKATLSPHSAVANETMLEAEQTELLRNLETFLLTGVPATPVNLV